jgi:2Fe-2S ferredoxin
VTELSLSVVGRTGELRHLRARRGESLMAVLRDQVDVEIGTCGGALSCGTCLVLFDEAEGARLPPAGADELEMLQALDAPPEARLACQLMLSEALDGMRLTVAPPAL